MHQYLKTRKNSNRSYGGRKLIIWTFSFYDSGQRCLDWVKLLPMMILFLQSGSEMVFFLFIVNSSLYCNMSLVSVSCLIPLVCILS